MARWYYSRYSKRRIGARCLDTENPRFSKVKVRECDRGHLAREVVQRRHERPRLGVQVPCRPLRKLAPAQPMLLRSCLPTGSDALLELCLVPVHVWQDLQHKSCVLAVFRAVPHTCAGHVVDRLELHLLGFSFCVRFLNRTPAELTFDADPSGVPVLPARHRSPAVRATPLGLRRTRRSDITIIRCAIVEVPPFIEINVFVVQLPRPICGAAPTTASALPRSRHSLMDGLPLT